MKKNSEHSKTPSPYKKIIKPILLGGMTPGNNKRKLNSFKSNEFGSDDLNDEFVPGQSERRPARASNRSKSRPRFSVETKQEHIAYINPKERAKKD